MIIISFKNLIVQLEVWEEVVVAEDFIINLKV